MYYFLAYWYKGEDGRRFEGQLIAKIEPKDVKDLMNKVEDAIKDDIAKNYNRKVDDISRDEFQILTVEKIPDFN